MGLWRAHQPETSGLSSGWLAAQEGPGVYPGVISVPGTQFGNLEAKANGPWFFIDE